MTMQEASPASPGDLREILRARPVVAGLVSVIVAVFQGEDFILGAVRSALAQTYNNIEVLVVDDGSTDGTLASLAELDDPRLSVFTQSNRGAAAARNLALSHASGEYIATLDADDRWFPEKLEKEIATLVNAPDPIGIAYSRYFAVDDHGVLLNRSKAYDYSGNVFEIMIDREFDIMTSISLFHRKIFEEIGGFDAGRRFHEDGAFMLKATKVYPVYPTKLHLVVYRQTTAGKCRRILGDYETARSAALSIVDDLRPLLSSEQAAILHDRQARSLYFRFLMYGYGESATRMLPDFDVRSLRKGTKGWIGWLHAKTGINLMHPARLVIQNINRAVGQLRWRNELARKHMNLGYATKP